jgi:hypothetical protein
MRGAIPLLPQHVFIAWCLVKHMDNFTFTFYIYGKLKGKVVPELNSALHHEDAGMSGGIAPRILNLCTRWGRVVRFTLWSL